MTQNANSGSASKSVSAAVVETAPASRAERSQFGAAESSLRQRLKLHPTDVVALKLLGNLYLRSSRHEEAEEQLSKALALAPQFSEARWLLAGTFVYRGNWKMALATTETLLAEDPDNCDYLDTKAYALCSSANSMQRLPPMSRCSRGTRPR